MFRRSSGLSAGKYPTPTLELNYAAASALSGLETFTRASSAWAFNSAGVLTQYAANLPRLDYDPLTLALRGLLMEEQRTNLYLQSDDLSNAATTRSNGSISGTLFTATDTSSVYIRQYPALADSTNHAWTVEAKPGSKGWIYLSIRSKANASYTAYINIATGALGFITGITSANVTVKNIGSGWWRCTIIAPSDTGGTTPIVQVQMAAANSDRTVVAGDTINLRRPQLEAGGFPTSYIPTTSAAATRAADACAIPASTFGFNATEGTLYIETQALHTTIPGLMYAQIDDGTNSNRLSIQKPALTQLRARTTISGSTVASLSQTIPSDDTVAKFAFAYGDQNFAFSTNGSAPFTATTPSALPAGLNRLAIGGAAPAAQWVRRIAYYPRRLDNASLARITS